MQPKTARGACLLDLQRWCSLFDLGAGAEATRERQTATVMTIDFVEHKYATVRVSDIKEVINAHPDVAFALIMVGRGLAAGDDAE